MALPGILAVGSAIGALLFARTRKVGGSKPSNKRERIDPHGALVDRWAVPATPDSDGTPRALEGLRYAVKDIFHIKNRTTGFGSPAWVETHNPAASTARAVQMCADAGALGVGVTHMDEFAYSISGENFHYGTPTNPHANGRIPGGSSSGSAVAVAANVDNIDFALGTDSGGSVRVPAAYCGVFGFRPTHKVVSTTGVITFAKTMDTVGWFARDPSVLAAVGDVLLNARLGASDSQKSKLPSKLLVLEDALDLCDTKAQCAVASVCASLETEFSPGTVSRLNLGQHLLTLCPSLREVQDRDKGTGFDALRFCFATIMGHELWEQHGQWYTARPFSENGDTGPGVKERMESASQLSESQVEICKKAREEVKVAMGILLDGGSEAALVFPTVSGAAPALNADESTQTAWRKKTLALTCICSLVGFPQVTVPLFENLENSSAGDGPRAVSFVMGPKRDYACLNAAVAYSQKIKQAYPEIVKSERARGGTDFDTVDPVSSSTKPSVVRGDPVGDPFKQKGNDLFKSGDFSGAIDAYADAIDAADRFASSGWKSVVLSNCAMARLKIGAYAEAEEDCSEALKLNSKNVKAFLRRGAARSVSGNYLEALEDFENALRFEPKNVDAKTEIVRMKNILGDAEQIPDFD